MSISQQMDRSKKQRRHQLISKVQAQAQMRLEEAMTNPDDCFIMMKKSKFSHQEESSIPVEGKMVFQMICGSCKSISIITHWESEIDFTLPGSVRHNFYGFPPSLYGCGD
jgi:hypothetical protein